MFPTQSPHGANYDGRAETREHLDELCDRLYSETGWTSQDVTDILSIAKSRLPRLGHGERLDGYLRRKPFGVLKKHDQRRLVNSLPIRRFRGLKAAAQALFSSQCTHIRKFLNVWRWVDTCLALAFSEETEETMHFKVKWWKILAHDIVSSGSIHYACKKWGKFSLYLTLHFGGAIQPNPQWESWFPRLPEGTWMVKEPGTLDREETARCRLLADKRGLPAGDLVTKQKAMDDHLQHLLQGDTLSIAQEADLVMYSGMAAEAIVQCVKGNWFENRTGHISVSNSACWENSRDFGGKRAYVLSALRGWLCELPEESRLVRLPTGECFEEREGVPRWVSVKPPGYDDAKDLPTGVKKTTGILTEDFQDGEQERVGFQLFSWAYSTLVEEGYLDSEGHSTGKPMPMSRIPIGEPGCKVRIATKTKAAFIVYGQPFAHSMRELLEFHPGLRAGLSSGYQLFEWLKGVDTVPDYVMVGDFESATDFIQHRAGKIAMKILLRKLNAANNGYAMNYVDLLLSPRVLEEDGIVTVTNSGCLMGEPGTKIVLTFLALVANCYARRGMPSKFFATAGDDQIDADNDPEELLRYAEASRVTTMVPSLDKWGIFRFSCLYCQQLLDITEKDPGKSEVPVPKPRLISPETKSNRGDDDTNPAYGKAKQFAREVRWSDFQEINKSMTVLFLRNMRQYIERRPEVFVVPEWGGLGLPGIPQKELYQLLPDWHQNLIAHRELGSPVAKKILANWSTSRIMDRGIETPDTSPYEELLAEFLPTAHFDQLGIDVAPRARYREKLKAAKLEGWIPLSDVIVTLTESTTYANIWDIASLVPSRGYSTIPWTKRTERLKRVSETLPGIRLRCLPAEPSWQPGLLTLVHGVFGLSEYAEGEVEDLEEGEIRPKVFPLMGTSCSPRVFLHYDNNRLILNATSR